MRRGALPGGILARLAGAPGGLTSTDLAPLARGDSLMRRQAAVSQALRRMERRGLVARSAQRLPPGTGRTYQPPGYLWRMTAAGREFQERAGEIAAGGGAG